MPSNKKGKAKARSKQVLVLPDNFPELQEKANKHNLDVLQRILRELKEFVATNNVEHVALTLTALKYRGDELGDKPWPVQTALELYCVNLGGAFDLYRDGEMVKKVIQDDDLLLSFISLLVSTGRFDAGLDLFAMQQKALGSFVQDKQHETEQSFRDFQSKSPVHKEHRLKESGFAEASKLAPTIHNAEQANELGKTAWRNKCKWQAELWWKRATELDSQAKYWSNLAFIRIHLGRYLRSLELGYRPLADHVLKVALTAAKRSIEMDAQWERGYQRVAEAHLAMGPYDHAMEACRILQKALDTLDNPPSPKLKCLYETVKDRALRWCSLGVPPAQSTIPRLIQAAVRQLQKAVIESLPRQADSEEANRAGEKIVDQAKLLHATLQLIYLRRDQWVRESDMDAISVQQQLVKLARLVPLEVVAKCDILKRLVFAEDPFTLWGLDRLDRAGVDYLSPDAEDPCEEDYIDSPEFTETVKRQSGGSSMSISEVVSVMDWIKGKTAHSKERDYTPNHLCAFSLMILQRLILATQSPLCWDAMARVIDFALLHNTNAFWNGGEFIGMAISAAVGIAKYDLDADPNRTHFFLRLPGGAAVVAIEINQSNDNCGSLQKALASLTPAGWAEQTFFDINQVLLQYILLTMDGTRATGVDEEASVSFAAEILSAMLDGHPEMITYFRTGTSGDNFGAFQPLFSSSFGVFLARQYLHAEERLLHKGQSTATKNVVQRITAKWGKLSKDRKSTYRWESLDEATKLQLASMAPVTKTSLTEARRKAKQSEKEKVVAVKGYECATCGKPGGIGVALFHCSCGKARYCSETCQHQDWPHHKELCKKLRRRKEIVSSK